MLFLKAYSVCFLSLAVLDALWLSVATPVVYAPMMGNLLRPDIQWPPAVAFYLLFPLGLTRLVVWPALKARRRSVALDAFIYGVCAYGTYNLSAWAVIRDWPGVLSLIDIAWGGSAALVSALMATYLLRLKASGD